MAAIGGFFGGLASGAAQGVQLGMAAKNQQELLDIQKKKADLEQMQSLVKITELPENIQEPFLKKWLKTNGIDPDGEDGQGKFYMELFKKASGDQREALSKTLAQLSLDGKFDLKSLGKADIHEILKLAPAMAKHQQDKADSATLAEIMRGAAPTMPAGGGSLAPMPQGQDASTEGIQTGPDAAPQIAPVAGVPMVPSAAQTQPRSIQGGSNGDTMGGAISPIAQRNVDMYQRLQLAATKVTSSERQKMLLDRADKIADNAWETLSPAQAGKMGFRSGAVVQFNPIKSEGKVLQAGQDTWRDLTAKEREAAGLPASGGGVAQVSSAGEKKVQETKDTFQIVKPGTVPELAEMEQAGKRFQRTSRGEYQEVGKAPLLAMMGESAFTKQRGEDEGKMVTRILQSRDTANELRSAADQTDEALKGFATGAFGDQRAFIAKLGQLFGAQDIVAPLTKGDTVSAEALDQVTNRMTSQFVDIFKGNTNKEEIGILRTQFPTLTRTVPGNKIVSELMRRRADQMDDIAQITEEHEGLPSAKDKSGKTLYSKIAEYRRENPLLTDDLKKRIAGTVKFSTNMDPTGTRPMPPKEYPDANFIGYDPTTGDPRFETREGRKFKVILGGNE